MKSAADAMGRISNAAKEAAGSFEEVAKNAAAARAAWKDWLKTNEGFPSPEMLGAFGGLIESVLGPDAEGGELLAEEAAIDVEGRPDVGGEG